MASYHVPPLERLVEQFERLPGIGHKSAQRLAYHVLAMTQEEVDAFAKSVQEAHRTIHYCKVCCNLTDQELCPVCRSDARDRSVICVPVPCGNHVFRSSKESAGRQRRFDGV